jgi:hypothetical protein
MSKNEAVNLNNNSVMYTYFTQLNSIDTHDAVSNRAMQLSSEISNFNTSMRGRIRTKRGDYKSIDADNLMQDSKLRGQSLTADPKTHRSKAEDV